MILSIQTAESVIFPMIFSNVFNQDSQRLHLNLAFTPSVQLSFFKRK